MGFAPKCAAIDVRPQDGRDPSHCRSSWELYARVVMGTLMML